MASRSNPTDQAAPAPAPSDGSQVVDGNNMIKSDKQQEQHDGPAAAAAATETKQSPHRRKRPNDKHNTKKQRRSRAERLEQERLLQESIRKHTRLLTASRNPELFVFVQRREFRDEDDWPTQGGPHTISEEDAES